MLRHLTIENIVLIQNLALDFDQQTLSRPDEPPHPSLISLTGETGGGKSILLDSLNLVLGRRAEVRLIRQGETSASVTGHFTPMGATKDQINYLLNEADISWDENDLILRRHLNLDGRSKAFLNDRPISVQLMRDIGDYLVEIQGQFDRQSIMDSSTHGQLLDDYGQHQALLERLKSSFGHWRNLIKSHEKAKQNLQRIIAQRDYLTHSVEELEEFDLGAFEPKELESQFLLLKNANKISDGIKQAINAVNGGYGEATPGADEAIEKALLAIEKVAPYLDAPATEGGEPANDNVSLEKMNLATQNLEQALTHLRDGSAYLQEVGRDIDDGKADLARIEERLYRMRELGRKYQTHVDELPNLLTTMRQDLKQIDDGEDDINRLKKSIDEAKQGYVLIANEMTKHRQTAAQRLKDAVNKEFPSLKLPDARFDVVLIPLDETSWNEQGQERVEFRIATNPNTAMGPLDKVASGGELSRLLLALKLSLADVMSAPTLIFDEVDSGIGGATATAVGERLAKLAKRLQLLVITHSAQVAAKGTHHWRVAKDIKNGTAQTSVSYLNEDERVMELARMIAGATITNEAINAAKQLIKESR